MPTTAFFLDLGDGRFRATPHTVGPWAPDAQHGGPPSALLGRAVEQLDPRADMLTARVSIDILGPVPVGEVTVRARVARPGRSVRLLEASLESDGRDVARATAWQVRRTAESVPAGTQVPPLPEGTDDPSLFGGAGYLHAVEWRPVRGGFGRPGPCSTWTRLRGSVVEGEEPSGLQRVLAVADSGNGVSWVLDLASTYFINPELTVHLHREPVGEWVLLDAVTTVSSGGVGLATSVLGDLSGEVGRGAQSLLVSAR